MFLVLIDLQSLTRHPPLLISQLHASHYLVSSPTRPNVRAERKSVYSAFTSLVAGRSLRTRVLDSFVHVPVHVLSVLVLLLATKGPAYASTGRRTLAQLNTDGSLVERACGRECAGGCDKPDSDENCFVCPRSHRCPSARSQFSVLIRNVTRCALYATQACKETQTPGGKCVYKCQHGERNEVSFYHRFFHVCLERCPRTSHALFALAHLTPLARRKTLVDALALALDTTRTHVSSFCSLVFVPVPVPTSALALPPQRPTSRWTR